ncbi:MAG TPA: 16S rRNA (guanine(527)-N(7))-methyltransferase RsmG [Steroidobacteraceae bacterium]|nr:16S rRNA (guanine(527)-N(7))-methyltransferase RsmG [Steroidobacteraceae bacterium]
MSDESGRLERAELIEQARLLNVSLGDAEAQRLALLLDELERWNAAYNLTSIRGREAMMTHHLLDSLSIHEYLKGARIADVGTGAGFPGLPLAVANPERQFTLIDSAGKKVRFVAHAARALGLGNVVAVHSRAEDMRPAEPFDTITARAFAGLPDLLESVYALARPGTRVLAMKGRQPRAEIAAVRAPWRVIEAIPLEVPRLGEVRHLIIAECVSREGDRGVS